MVASSRNGLFAKYLHYALLLFCRGCCRFLRFSGTYRYSDFLLILWLIFFVAATRQAARLKLRNLREAGQSASTIKSNLSTRFFVTSSKIIASSEEALPHWEEPDSPSAGKVSKRGSNILFHATDFVERDLEQRIQDRESDVIFGSIAFFTA